MSFSYTVVLADDGHDNHHGTVVEQAGVEGNAEALNAVNALNDAVTGLFTKGVFGDKWKNHEWQVNIVGHFNEDHEPVEGWSNDFLTVGVVQLEDNE